MLLTVLEGWRIAPGASWGRKVRTPQGTTLRNPVFTIGIHSGGRLQGLPTDSATENRQPAVALTSHGAVMVKRCGKSAPREAQATRHGKPRRVQDQIGNPGTARSSDAKADGFRVSVAKTNDSLRRKAQTKFGLQPFQNHSFRPEGRIPEIRKQTEIRKPKQ